MTPRVPLELPKNLRDLIAKHGNNLIERVERFLDAAPRRCTYVTSERVASHPLKRTGLGRLLRRPTSAPSLEVLRSKFGGLPYFEEPDLVWKEFGFLGQVNFGEIDDRPSDAPSEGILAVDRAPVKTGSFRVRWYPHPTEAAAQRVGLPICVGRWETRLRFRPGWSLPGGNAWHSVLPQGNEELWDAWNDWSAEGYLDDERNECHRILGHRSAGLDEHYGFEPPPGGSDSVEDYEMLWRITFDNPAGFAWGTNWVCIIVHREDLPAGRLERAVSTGANY